MTRLAETLAEIRSLIDGKEPRSEAELRRLSLRATSRISNPDKAAKLSEDLVSTLSLLSLFRVMHYDTDDVGRDALEIIEEIVTASRPN